ncbi:unnamed protein product [Arctogadus glacialis]
MLGRYSPGGAVKIDLPAPFTRDGSQSFLSWARQLEVAVGATAGGGHGCTEELREEKFRRFLAGLDPALKTKCLEMGATDLEEALHVAERCENARMTLQRDYGGELVPSCCDVSLADVMTIPPLSEALVPVNILTPAGASQPAADFKGYPEPNIPETTGLVVARTVSSVRNGPVSLEESPVTAEQRAKLAELLQRFTDVFNLGDRNTGRIQLAGLKLNSKKCHFARDHVVFLGHVVSRDGLQPDPRNTDKTLSSQMLLQPGFAPWPQWRCLTTLHLQTGHKQSQFLSIHSVVVELNCGQHSVKTLKLVLC